MEQIYHFYEGKANNLMRVCGVLKSFSTFILLCKMKLGCTSKILKTYFGISLGLTKFLSLNNANKLALYSLNRNFALTLWR